MKKTTSLIIFFDDPYVGERVDKSLLIKVQETVPEMSRTRLQSLILQGSVHHDDVPVLSPKAHLQPGTYTVIFEEAEDSHLEAEDIFFKIIFEDEDIIVIDKPAGLTVHPGAGQPKGTLVNGLLYRFGDTLSGISGVKRPGIVHRLDKDTSGLLVVAKNDAAHKYLSKQFEDHTLKRTYLALAHGVPMPRAGMIHTRLGRHPRDRQRMTVLRGESSGKEAITHYRVMEVFTHPDSPTRSISLIECRLETGRTHQIRVHLSHLGHPLVGDPVYGKKTVASCFREILEGFHRQALHAQSLEFIHPRTNELVRFTCTVPTDMEDLIQKQRYGQEGIEYVCINSLTTKGFFCFRIFLCKNFYDNQGTLP